MKNLPLITLVRMIKSFVGIKEWDNYEKSEKIDWISNYRKVEKESAEAIERYGSVEAWYESGEGRLLNLG